MAKDFWAYCDQIAGELPRLRISEASAEDIPTPAGGPIDERLAQCIWFDSLFVHQSLVTDNHQPLEIVAPGRWNEEEGPDFRVCGAKP